MTEYTHIHIQFSSDEIRCVQGGMAVDSVQFSSVAQSCLTLCNPMDCSTPDLPVCHQLMEFTQTHVHWVGDAIQPSHPLVHFSSCLQSFPASGSFQMSQLFTSGGKALEFQLQHQSFQCTYTPISKIKSPTKIKYNRLIWQTKETKTYIGQNKTN